MEGPSIVILKESLQQFKNRKVLKASGYADIDFDRINNQTVKDFKSWGKHFIIQFRKFSIRIHYLMFGSYRINDRKKGSNPKLSLKFSNGELNSYVCSVKFIEEDLNNVYDWEMDIMSKKFNATKLRKLLKGKGDEMIGDVLLNPDLFSGVGNIIRNEVLYRIKVHPDSLISALPSAKLTAVIKESRDYSFDFLRWKKENVLKKNWLIYTKKKCPKGHLVSKEYTGKTKRRSFICDCLKQY